MGDGTHTTRKKQRTKCTTGDPRVTATLVNGVHPTEPPSGSSGVPGSSCVIKEAASTAVFGNITHARTYVLHCCCYRRSTAVAVAIFFCSSSRKPLRGRSQVGILLGGRKQAACAAVKSRFYYFRFEDLLSSTTLWPAHHVV